MTANATTAISRPHSVHRDGVVIMLVSAVTFSTAGLFTKGVTADAWSVIFWRGLFAAAFMAVYIVQRRGFSHEILRMGWPGVVVTIVSTAGMMAFITSFKLTTIANASLIYATGPFLSAGLAWFWLRERPTLAIVLASVAALGGVAIILGGSIGGGSLRGDLLALFMTLMLSVMMVIYRRYPETPAVGPMAASVVLSMPFCLTFGDPFTVEVSEIGVLAVFGLVFSVAAVTMLEGARRLPPAEASLISALETPLAPIWAWMILAELPTAYTVIGGGIILAAVFGSQAWSLRQGRAAAVALPGDALGLPSPARRAD